MNLGERIRRLRESRKQSLAELANDARIPSCTLALIEAGSHYPRLYELERLLAALQVPFNELSGFSD